MLKSRVDNLCTIRKLFDENVLKNWKKYYKPSPVRSVWRKDVLFHSAPVNSSRICYLSVPAVLQWPWKPYRFNIISYLVRTIITVQHDLICIQILYICWLKEYSYTVTSWTIWLSQNVSVPGIMPWLPLLKGHVTHLPPCY